MKRFERLVMAHINTIIPNTLDPLKFAYRPTYPQMMPSLLHSTLPSPTGTKAIPNVRMLFIDYSSAFSIIVPSKLIPKLWTLGMNASLCNWILDFLTGRSQVGRVGNNTSSTLIINTEAPQRCVLSPRLYSLFTHNCVAMHDSNTIIKFAHDSTVVGLITYDDGAAYGEVRDLAVRCKDKNLSLNVSKTKDLICGLREKERRARHIGGAVVERVESFKFLGVHIHTVVKRARKCLFPLRKLKRFGTNPQILKFYSCTIESILTGYITAWYGN
ncbi:uncharacterized protein LOC127912799 [Oncorhynchus keta]|uniref:uncharacterized protein LOC127912799 n=1 Tax=Oncorhynchus keta TaxID=8018 RepID=UPI00227AECCE|nr:uncharacterized protein LOC127912799 [Oncorhynchus keta]